MSVLFVGGDDDDDEGYWCGNEDGDGDKVDILVTNLDVLAGRGGLCLKTDVDVKVAEVVGKSEADAMLCGLNWSKEFRQDFKLEKNVPDETIFSFLGVDV